MSTLSDLSPMPVEVSNRVSRAGQQVAGAPCPCGSAGSFLAAPTTRHDSPDGVRSVRATRLRWSPRATCICTCAGGAVYLWHLSRELALTCGSVTVLLWAAALK